MSALLQPLQMGNLILKNRLVMPPMSTAKAESDGSILLRQAKADLIGVGRAIMADSAWARKAVEQLQ